MLNQLKNDLNVGYTLNGAGAYETTQNAMVDFFSQAGAMRNRSEQDIISEFTQAFGEDKLLAMKALFYFRDIRSGQGERRLFRIIIRYLADHHSETMEKNLTLIPYFGRWDDIYELFGTRLEAKAADFIKQQYIEDISSETPSLLGKWLKSENASSFETKKLAKRTRIILGLTPRQYRKSLSALREKINIVERHMSSKEWHEIDYAKLPSVAGLKYRQAFFRNDLERYEAFIESLVKGETTVNVKDLYPYDLVRKVYGGGNQEDVLLDQMWKRLPNYIGDANENSMVVVDVSGSMSGLPMDVAISIGLYLAERNHGHYHNHFITFSERPKMVEIKGSTFAERVRNIKRADWEMSTNMEAVFDLILNSAIKNNIPKEEMVKKLYIVSDMQFDKATKGRVDISLFENIRERYISQGYELPVLTFWNVNSYGESFPMTVDDRGFLAVSGCSPSIFTNLMKGEFVSPYDLMVDVLNDERYSVISI